MQKPSRTPMEPIGVFGNPITEESLKEIISNEGHCPICNSWGTYTDNFCSHCGQALLWHVRELIDKGLHCGSYRKYQD